MWCFAEDYLEINGWVYVRNKAISRKIGQEANVYLVLQSATSLRKRACTIWHKRKRTEGKRNRLL